MLVCCLGMKRSGSTWQYNAIRELVERLGVGEAHGFLPDDEIEDWRDRLEAWALDPRVHVLKTHYLYQPGPETAGQTRAAYTYRDLREVAGSMQRQFAAYGERLNRLLEEATETWYWASRQPWVLMQRYEDFTADPATAVREICSFFNWSAEPALVAEVVAACSPEAMKRVVNAESRGPLKRLYHWGWHLNRRLPIKRWLLRIGFPESVWNRLRRIATPYDSRTLLRPGHISKRSREPSTLEPGLRRHIEQRFGRWLKDAGYPPVSG